jgi:thymidylate kinase
MNLSTIGIPKPSRHTEVRLSLIDDLLHSFHNLDITYCHWKSNEHLAASMVGVTDLDILFDDQNKPGIEAMITNCGFKEFVSIKEKQYKDIQDYIGLDLPSGRIVHLHAHFKLTLGECYLKGYQLNLEKKILDSRVFDSDFGIYRSAPAFELVLLYFRHALKIRNRDILKFYLKKDITYSRNIMNEYHWLKARCSNAEIEALLKPLFKDHAPIYNLVTKTFNYQTILKLSHLLRKSFKDQRLYPPLTATILRWYREIAVKTYRKWSTISSQPVISQRVHPRHGLIVAMIGADGSGKSTVIGDLHATFKKKIDVYNLYMGRGKSGNASWQRKILGRFKKNYSKVRHRENKTVTSGISTNGNKSFKYNLFKCIEALAVARERQKKLKMMQTAKAKGMLVICDRFPQNQFMGYNDGPALSYLLHSKSFLFRWSARKEAKTYKLTEDNPPDILFKLVADADVVAGRKPSKASLEMLELKIEGIKRLKFLHNCVVVTIDANQPLNEVILPIKKHLWNAWA